MDMKKQKAPKKKDSEFARKYQTFCFRLIYNSKTRSKKTGADESRLEEKLKKAGLNLTPELYTSMMIVTTIIVTSTALMVSLLLFVVILSLPDGILIILLMTAISAGGTAAAFPFVISSRISNRKTQIDKELPFMVSELSILASTGLSPIEIIRRIAAREKNEAMKFELMKAVYKADVEGKDIVTALGETAKESPSDLLREILWDLSNMIHQGGELDEYLRMKADDMLNLKRSIQKEFVDRLAGYSEMYVTGVLMVVLLLGVGSFLIDATGSTAGGMSADTILQLVAFAIIPLAIFVIGLFVTMSYSKTE